MASIGPPSDPHRKNCTKYCVDGFHCSDEIPLCLTILETVDRGLGKIARKIASMDFIGPIKSLFASLFSRRSIGASEKVHEKLRRWISLVRYISSLRLLAETPIRKNCTPVCERPCDWPEPSQRNPSMQFFVQFFLAHVI